MANVMPSLSIAGIPQLQQLLKELGPKVLGEGVKAMRKAMQPVVKDAKRRIQVGWGFGSGQLKKSIGVIYGRAFKDRQRAVVKVGPRRFFNTSTTTERSFGGHGREWYSSRIRIRNRKHDPRNIAHLVEFGHRIAVGGKFDYYQGSRRRGTLQLVRGRGVSGGMVKPMPFLRPAFDANRAQAINTLVSELRRSLVKLHAKQAARRAA